MDEGIVDIGDDDTSRSPHHSEKVLPPEWTQCYDENYGCFYYYNSLTGISQWEIPDDDDISNTYSEDFDLQKSVYDWKIDDIKIGDDQISAPREGLSFEGNVITRPTHLSGLYSDIEEYSDMDDFSADFMTFGEVLTNRRRWNIPCMASRLEKKEGLNQDYEKLAKSYLIERIYAQVGCDLRCVICGKKLCTQVFFPCSHRCVCDDCISRETICDEMTYVVKHSESVNSDDVFNGHCNCPLCGSIIKLIVAQDHGNEEERYWEWCNEYVPELPRGFSRRFRQAGEAIKTIYIEKNSALDQDPSCCIG